MTRVQDKMRRNRKRTNKHNKTKQKQKTKKRGKEEFPVMARIVRLTKQSPPEESVDSCLMYTVGNRIIDIPSILSE